VATVSPRQRALDEALTALALTALAVAASLWLLLGEAWRRPHMREVALLLGSICADAHALADRLLLSNDGGGR
jgi:hypothetical protein